MPPEREPLDFATRTLVVLMNLPPGSAAPVPIVLKTAQTKTTQRASVRTLAVWRSTPLLNLQLMLVRDLVAEQIRTRSPKSPLLPIPPDLAASHPSGIPCRVRRQVAQTLATQKFSGIALKVPAPMLAASHPNRILCRVQRQVVQTLAA